MKITYDDEANASFIYFASIGVGGVAKTIPYQKLDVELDKDNQIVVMRLFESEDCEFQNRLEYVLRHPNVAYDEAGQNIEITFAMNPEVQGVISWDANIDLDSEGQIIGLEILFADPEYQPEDENEMLHAEGKLKYVSKYIVPFDALH